MPAGGESGAVNADVLSPMTGGSVADAIVNAGKTAFPRAKHARPPRKKGDIG